MSRDSHACGGTFCDSGPSATPVDQTGENVLFVLDGNTVEAHVQIQYVGGATRFAWIVPMPKVPAVTVGSQPLFNALLQGTVPTYGVTRSFDQCGSGVAGSGGSFNGGTAGSGTGGSFGEAGGSGGGPTVVYQKIVGSFEVAVLQGGTAQEVSDWLASNGYQTVPNVGTLLEPYVQKSFVFTAIKLTADADVSEIHPLVFKYAGNEPCVPLQLTAVAAQPDMGVRTFFLGDDRVYPSNYAHVTLNPVRLDWSTNASNYKTAVSRAVDSPGSDGHGFVTEYAGPSNVIGANFYSPAWNAEAFRTASPSNVLNLINAQGLAYCQYQYQCQFMQPLILPLLQQYLPLAAGADPSAYACFSCGADAGACTGCNGVPVDTGKWDGNAFADALQTRVIDPAMHAQALLQRWQYLTRLYTTISPEEMTLDPTFKAMPEHDYELVNLRSDFGNLRTTCCGQQVMEVPLQGEVPARQVALNGGSWPPFSSLMPWAEKIEQAPLLGDLMTVADNSQAVDTELARWNATQGWPAAGGGGQAGYTCAASGGSGAVSGSVSYGGSVTGTAGVAAGLQPGGGSSCDCSVPGRRNTLGLAGVLALVGVGLLRRRRG